MVRVVEDQNWWRCNHARQSLPLVEENATVLRYVEIDTFKVKINKCPKNETNEGKRMILLHVRIGPAQIDVLIMRPSRLSFFEN